VALTTLTGTAALTEWPPQACDGYPPAQQPGRAKGVAFSHPSIGGINMPWEPRDVPRNR